MLCLNKKIPSEIWEVLPKGLRLHYVSLDTQYLLSYGDDTGNISLSIEDILDIEKKCIDMGLPVRRFGTVSYRLQLHIQVGSSTWKFVSQSSCSSIDSNSNPRLYGYLKEV